MNYAGYVLAVVAAVLGSSSPFFVALLSVVLFWGRLQLPFVLAT